MKTKIQNKVIPPSVVSMEDYQKALSVYNEALEEDTTFRRSTAGAVGRTFLDWESNVSVKSAYHRGDYEHFRAAEQIPRKMEEIIQVCDKAYRHIGIIRNVIDLMSEFAAKGVRLQHTNSSIENFYEVWFDKISGRQVAEKFLNLIYRLGNLVSHRKYYTISKKELIKWKQGKGKKSVVQNDDITLEEIITQQRQIPLEYSFLPVDSLQVVGGSLAAFTNKYEYELKIGILKSRSDTRSGYPTRSSRMSKDLESLPLDIRTALRQGKDTIKLDNSRIQHHHYKKDDWQIWAYPMIFGILQDLIMYDKMKLADVSALDGVITNVRLWRLGFINESNVSQSILPTKSGINKLRNILANNVGGGTLDLVWGPELDFKESASEVWRWLGSEKYEPVLDAIYDGIGIPGVLRTGSGKDNAGNIIGLQTLIERLEYGRGLLVEFLQKEIDIVHNAMGFTKRKITKPTIAFDQTILSDRSAEKQLLINLADRNIISNESVLETFNKNSDIEVSRIKRENKKYGVTMPYKAGPFNNPDKEHEYKKLLLQGGSVSPSEIGLKLEMKKPDEKNRLDYMADTQIRIGQSKLPKKFDPTGTVQDGRPKNVVETQKRKPKPQTSLTKSDFTTLFLWASDTQSKIGEIVVPGLLKYFNKGSLRELSKEEFEQCEDIKLRILCNLKPYESINSDRVKKILDSSPLLNGEIVGMVKLFRQQFSIINNREPNLNETRQIYASSYTTFYTGE
uniref:Uncharacterized protein n=1 Tax=viral metagenome TaxID=1070528 RepID=A0A6M3L9Q1_9ZZZZ